MEQTIPKPLSGTEVIEAIVHDLRRALLLDDRLAPHSSYDSFAFKANITVSLPPTAVQKEFTRELAGGAGKLPLPADSVATVEATREEGAPNAVRLDTDQPIPTLVEENGVTVERMVPYKGKDASGRPTVPKQGPGKRNVSKGGGVVA